MSLRLPATGAMARWLASSVAMAGFLEVMSRVPTSVPLSLHDLAARWLFSASILAAASWLLPWLFGRRLSPSAAWLLVAVAFVGSTLLYVIGVCSWAAWALLLSLDLVLLIVGDALCAGRPWWQRWALRLFLASLAGAVPAIAGQLESHFAEEEFFVLLQTVSLALFWLLLVAANRWVMGRLPPPSLVLASKVRIWVLVGLILGSVAGVLPVARAYQTSMYAPTAPPYPGISASHPFLCSDTPSPGASDAFDGDDVFGRLLRRVEANPEKSTPEYGMLALGTRQRSWAETFRESLLAEAATASFTGPANSMKSEQYDAALRVYYFARLRDAFPDLFSATDLSRLQAWFAAINRRALTAEWVDWMYGLAFTKAPQGPYENQEIGAGLLALLESEQLAGPRLSTANRQYLDRERRGWAARFRNTDDAYSYQPIWIENALFQSLYTRSAPGDHVQTSFEWLLLQALPDGSSPNYNYPIVESVAAVAYLGARLTNDSRYLWLAGQAVTDLEKKGEYLLAQPGVEQPVRIKGSAPTAGSCLMYGDSGLPNQAGPLAPDKAVLRSGWSADSSYLLLNLRFAGWHRYKATNTIAMVYQDGLVAADNQQGAGASWLPVGRSAFRDKRVPRQNLNGMLVARSGMSAALATLAGGGDWAQDPPLLADVVRFDAGSQFDDVHTRVTGWRGWQQDRRIYLYHDGPIVVIDDAAGPAGSRAAIAWHLAGSFHPEQSQGYIRLRSGQDSGQVVLLPGPEAQTGVFTLQPDGRGGTGLLYTFPQTARPRLATVFLPKGWGEAALAWAEGPDGPIVRVAQKP